jgi:hypothetical protein
LLTSTSAVRSDSGKKRIGVCKLDGSACSVVTTAVEKPRGVAIHVAKKLLVFTDWGARPQVDDSLDISISVADPGCLSRVRIFTIPDPGSKRFRIRICIKEFKYFNPKN